MTVRPDARPRRAAVPHSGTAVETRVRRGVAVRVSPAPPPAGAPTTDMRTGVDPDRDTGPHEGPHTPDADPTAPPPPPAASWPPTRSFRRRPRGRYAHAYEPPSSEVPRATRNMPAEARANSSAPGRAQKPRTRARARSRRLRGVAGLLAVLVPVVVGLLTAVLFTGERASAQPAGHPAAPFAANPAGYPAAQVVAPQDGRPAAAGLHPRATPPTSPSPSASTSPTGTASPSPSGSPGSGGYASFCDQLMSPAKEECQARTGSNPLSFAADPLGAIAKSTAEAAVWFISKLTTAINATTAVDFTNPGFLRQYAVVFAASAFLTLIVWMVAVTKRAVRGVPLGTAIGEAVGYLWLAVMASAFTPLALHLSVSLVDSITAAIASGTKQDTDQFMEGFSKGLDPQSLGGGPVTLIFVSMFAILAAMILWIELLVRAALLYVGAILGTIVYAGVVDRDLWGHVRRWVGMMVAILLAKPIIVIVLGLAMAAGSGGGSDALAGVLTGLAIMFLAIFASVMVYRFIPALGDDIGQLRAGRMEMAAGGKAALTGGTASYVKAGMGVHAGRGTTATATASTGSSSAGSAAGGVASGMSAHGYDSASSGSSGGSGGGSGGSGGSGGGGPALRSPRWLDSQPSAPPPPPTASGMPYAADPPPAAPRTPSPRQGD